MCAIFGAPDYVTFCDLYSRNLYRGDFAFGGVFYSDSNERVLRQEGKYQAASPHDEFSYYLGHTQAPTSAAQTFDRSTSHPFRDAEWLVAHNGVLTNYPKLKSVVRRAHTNIVDSSIIPVLLSELNTESELGNEATNQLDLVKTVCEMLEGTYTLWIHDSISKDSYIVRCGSTLFMNQSLNTFSSTKIEGMTEVPDGSILCVDSERQLKLVGQFTSNSPFFIL